MRSFSDYSRRKYSFLERLGVLRTLGFSARSGSVDSYPYLTLFPGVGEIYWVNWPGTRGKRTEPEKSESYREKSRFTLSDFTRNQLGCTHDPPLAFPFSLNEHLGVFLHSVLFPVTGCCALVQGCFAFNLRKVTLSCENGRIIEYSPCP